ncbi:MAG: hypothetical protein JNK60_17325 [Acidobacteria bacterium]|nr:hypothetical protein [Acidobacteriota bacterium]
MNIPTIETERLRLRAFESRDLEAYAERYADPEFVRYLDGKPARVCEILPWRPEGP